jgi:UDP-N-acetylmuramate--L-alanine ligase/UDP-N-acetylenolpyruvoylglucosamine reductase
LLTALMNHRNNIAVAGTHGKTTTTAMIAHVLTRSDSPPSYCVGANVPILGTNAQIGGGDYFVAEADESDGTLIGFTPEYSVCLNIEPEHLDFHRSMDRLLATFESFITSTLKTLFYCADCPNSSALAQKHRNPISFGLSPSADYRALNIQPTERGSRFTVWCRDQQMGDVDLQIPGWQNVVNALAAIAVADELGVPFLKIAEALAQFTGAKRRFDRKYEGAGILVVDDYAHHPTEIRATIAAARSVVERDSGKPFRRVLLAFQPHRYTRTQALLKQFATAFRGVDKLFLTEIYAASESPMAGVTGEALAETVRATGQKNVEYAATLEALTERLLEEAQAGDLILTMGAGDIYKVADNVAQTLSACAPQTLRRGRQTMNIESDLRAALSDNAKLRVDEPLAKHTSLRVGGPAEFWIEPWDERDLAKVLRYCHGHEIPVTLIGRGTNMLVRDGGIRGVVIHLGSDEFAKVEVDGERLIARAGARLKTLVNTAKKHDIGGFEFMEGIPGSLGGALRMNAGAMGKSTFDLVEWVRYVSLTGEIYDAKAGNLPVTYRSCPIFNNHVAITAIMRGVKTPRSTIDERLRTFSEKRWCSQPAQPSAGCIFKNPAKIPAGRLIEELGLKGTTVGGARVSELHGNFIVNEGGATATDVLALIAKIRERARDERGIDLEPEVMVLGVDKLN